MQLSGNNDELKVLSIAELKQYDGFNDISNEDALQIIETLKQLSLISHSIVSKHE